MKKVNLKVLGFVVAILISAGAFAQEFTIDGINYKVDYDDSFAVNVVSGDYSGDIIIPEQVVYDDNTFVVAGIEHSAFYFKEELTSIVLPNTITAIPSEAFEYDKNLKNIQIGNNMQKIGFAAFLGCHSLTQIIIPDSVKTISECCFEYCTSLETVIIGSGCKTIQSAAFGSCKKLKKVVMGENLVKISSDAFRYCSVIDTIILLSETPSNSSGGINTEETIVIVPCGTLENYKNSDWNSCTLVEDCDDSGIKEITENNTISFYPNPTKDKVTITADGDVTIFNSLGQIAKVVKDVKGIKEIDVSDLESGVYYVKIGDITKKLIIE